MLIAVFSFFFLLLAFLLGFEFRQLFQVLPPQHRLVLVQLQVLGSLHCLDDLGGLRDSHFLDFVAVEEAFDVYKVVPALIVVYLLAEIWS